MSTFMAQHRADSGDTYLQGRITEALARQNNAPENWLAFANMKAAKGSYPMAALGYLNSYSAL